MRESTQRSRWRRPLMIVALAVIGWWALLYLLQDFLVFPGAYLGGGATDADPPADVELASIEPEPSVRVEAWLLQPMSGRTSDPISQSNENLDVSQRSQPRGRCVLVYLHGNGELIDHQLGFARELQRRGAWVFLPEYRGYGLSTGRPSRAAIRADMLRWTRWLAARPELDGLPLVIHGRSLGGGVAADLAADLAAQGRPPAGLILESTMAAVAPMAWRYGAPPLLVRHAYAPVDVVRSATWPVLILHSANDEVMGGGAGPELRDAAPPGIATYHAFAGRHNEAGLGDVAAYWAAVDAFLDRVVPVPVR